MSKQLSTSFLNFFQKPPADRWKSKEVWPTFLVRRSPGHPLTCPTRKELAGATLIETTYLIIASGNESERSGAWSSVGGRRSLAGINTLVHVRVIKSWTLRADVTGVTSQCIARISVRTCTRREIRPLEITSRYGSPRRWGKYAPSRARFASSPLFLSSSTFEPNLFDSTI